jgi:hypothetical protein
VATSDFGRTEQRARYWWEPACRRLAFAVPLVVAVFRTSASTQWRDDLAVVRGLGLTPVGTEGLVSTVLTQLAVLVPVGGRLLRAGWVSAFGLALCAALVYLIARRLLELSSDTPRLTPPLALAAALTATLGVSWQLEGTIAGGVTVACALVLFGLETALRARPGDGRTALVLGAVSGLALVEAHAAGIALLAVLGALGIYERSLPTPRRLGLFIGGVAVALALGAVFFWLRPLAERASLDLGRGLGSSSLTVVDAAAPRTTALGAWLEDVGVVSAALALGGFAVGLARARTRRSMVPWLALLLCDLAYPASRVGVLTPDPFAPIRLLSLIGLALAGAVIVQGAATGLRRARIPFAEPAAVLLIAFHFTLAFVSAEASAYAADRRAQNGAEIWTDEALAAAPPDALLLVRSEAYAYRLWAAADARGERPDLTVVPLPLLERGNVRAKLLGETPELAPLIREMAVSGRPSEFAMSSLADARTLLVEFDPTWDPRLREHLLLRAFWMQFTAHPLARSDRKASLQRGNQGFSRVLEATSQPGFRDAATRAVLSATLRERAIVLASLGDREVAAGVAEALAKLDPTDPLPRELKVRLNARARGAVDVAGLLP